MHQGDDVGMERTRLRPFDPRLLRYAGATRRFMALVVLLGAVSAALIIVQAVCISTIVVRVFQQGDGIPQISTELITLSVVTVLRSGVAYATEHAAFSSAAVVKSQLRLNTLERITQLGPVWTSGTNSGATTASLTRGIDGLDGYFARYLPQLVLAVIVPIAVGVVILTQDLLATVIIVLTVPLIPVFMILIGMYTSSQINRQWRTLNRLSGHFVDIIAGLPTLKAFGRAQAQARNVQKIGQQYVSSTMGVLRVSFLSALVLELLATLSVALVAVSIGLRLMDGRITLQAGLLVLILTPEVYLPLRQVGVHFHAAAEGLGAADDVMNVLDQQPPSCGSVTEVPPLHTSRLELDGLTIRYPGRGHDVITGLSAQIPAAVITAIVGPSGVGKSSILAVLERFSDPSDGHIFVVDESGSSQELRDFDIDAWRAQTAWVGQHPVVVRATVADNVRLARPDASEQDVWAALAAVGLEADIAQLPQSLHTPVGEGGRALSVGQQRRLALARAICQQPQLVLLDEPTAGVDEQSEQLILASIRQLAEHSTVVLVAHRESLIATADHVIDIAPTDSETTTQTSIAPARDTTPTRHSPTAEHVPTPLNQQPATPEAARRPLRTLWPIIRPRRGRGILAILLGSLAIGCSIALLATSGWLISRASQQPAMIAISIAVVGVRAFGIGRGVFRYAERLVSHSAALRGLTQLRVAIVERLAVVAPAGLRGVERGDALRRMVDDVDTMADYWLRYLQPVGVALVTGAATVAFAVWLLPTAGVSLAICLVGAAVLAVGAARAAGARAARIEATLKGRLAADINRTVIEVADLTAARSQHTRLREVADIDLQVRQAERGLARGLGWAGCVQALGMGLAIIFMVVTAVPAVRSGSLEGVNLAVLVLLPLATFEVIAALPTAGLTAARASSSAERIDDLLALPDPCPDPRDPVATPGPPAALTAHSVTASWPDTDQPAVHGVDLAVGVGQRIAVIGPSGSGKSTLAAVLMHFLPTSSGEVALSGTSYSRMTGDQVRSIVGLVEQDAHIFDNTIAENVRLAQPEATDDDLRHTLDQVGLGSWIHALPHGIHTRTGQDGTQLSGGQRRRIALARILLSDPQIVILDEPTEHLDRNAANELLALVCELTADRGLIWITHDLSQLNHFDRVIDLSRQEVAVN